MAKQQLTADEESIMKRNARRRFIGAVALITSVVVILPMVFDSEPPPDSGSNIELIIPDKDKVGEFHALRMPVSARSTVVEAVSSVPASSVVSGVAAAVQVASAPVMAKSTAASAPVQEQARGEVANEAITHTAKKESFPRNLSKPVENRPAVPHTGYVVQVGAYTNVETVTELKDKLGKQGYHVYTEKIGSKIRVRVGGFATHEAADKVRHQLQAQGLSPNVVNLDN